MNLFDNALKSLLAPEEKQFAKALQDAYNADKVPFIASLLSQGVTAAAALKKLADAQIASQAEKFGQEGVLLAPLAEGVVNNLIDKAVAAAPSIEKAVEPYADHLVAKFVAALEAA